MPNHVASTVTAKLSVIKQLLNSDLGVDFNQIIPQPANIEKGMCSWGNTKAFDDNGEVYHPETGEVCWYDWNIKHWGTKWGAYDQAWLTPDGQPPTDTADSEPVTVKFETAWAMPLPVFQKLAADNRTEAIHVEYADEDLGSNVGILDFNLDRDVYFKDLADTNEGRDLACKLHYGQTWAEVKAEWDYDASREEPAEEWVDDLIATVRAADEQR